jgi:short-subunit dehydrogenase
MKAEHWKKTYGPWAVVTGASDGIGREVALQLATAGLNVLLVARRREVLESLAETLEAHHGVQARAVAVDLGWQAGVEEVVAASNGLDVGLLVAAAGFGTSGPFLASDLAEELSMIDVNCRAVAALSHHFGRRFARRGSGGLVLMSSIVAFQGVPRAANYAATKAYVQSLAEGLRIELEPHGVDVLASAPGPVHSGFAERAGMRMGQALKPQDVARGTLVALGGYGTVRPGWLSKLLGGSLALLPRWGRVRIMTAVMGGMTRHRNDFQATTGTTPGSG